MATASGAEAASPGGVVRVRVGADGRTERVRLSPWVMQLSAAELANDIVCVNVLAAMMFQVSQDRRPQHQLSVYADFVTRFCGSRRRQNRTGRVPLIPALTQRLSDDHDSLSRQLLARVKRIEDLLAGAPANVEFVGGQGDVVVSVDPAGQLANLWLSPRCMNLYRAADLEGLLNHVLATASVSDGANRLSMSA